MDKQPTIWDRKPHTAAKHSILRRYLEAWFPKLAWTGKVVFIDGFAGPGKYSGGELGSPLIALYAALEHKANLSNCELLYLFVERDAARFQHLNGLLDATPTPEYVKCRAIRGEFVDEVGAILDGVEDRGNNLAPSFVMIDPFGFSGMPFDLIRRIAKYPRSEFLISFMYESIVRWRNHPNHEETFDRLFGCKEWREADKCEDAEERKRRLLAVYVTQLRQAGMEYVRTFEMRDEGNRTEYFLVFATHSLEGLKAMKYAMWKADPSGAFRFSDATVSDQLTLFSPKPDFDLLRSLLVAQFAGKEVSIAALEKFVLADTPFRESHYKKQILAPMEKAQELRIVRSPRERPYSYPPGTILAFPSAGK